MNNEIENEIGEHRSSPDRLPVSCLVPNPSNPRRRFDADALEDLADDIERRGQLVPIIVRDSPTRDGMFEIVAGERRWRALVLREIEMASVTFRGDLNNDDRAAFAVAVVDNIEREELNKFELTMAVLEMLRAQFSAFPHWDSWESDLNPIDRTALLLKRWVRGSDANHPAIAQQLGVEVTKLDDVIGSMFRRRHGMKPNSYVANCLPLLGLPEDVTAELRAGTIPYSVAPRIGSLSDPADRAALLQMAKTQTTRAVHSEIKRRKEAKASPSQGARRSKGQRQIDALLQRVTHLAQRANELSHNERVSFIAALRRASAVNSDTTK